MSKRADCPERARAAFTEADYNIWKFHPQEAMHIPGQGLYGYLQRCIDQPRLIVIDRHFRQSWRTPKRYYAIDDGETKVYTLAEALAALSDTHRLEGL